MFDVQLDEGGQCAEDGKERSGVVCYVCHSGGERNKFSQTRRMDHSWKEAYNMISSPPVPTICSGRSSSSQSNARG